jgi:hypothetical protein
VAPKNVWGEGGYAGKKEAKKEEVKHTPSLPTHMGGTGIVLPPGTKPVFGLGSTTQVANAPKEETPVTKV